MHEEKRRVWNYETAARYDDVFDVISLKLVCKMKTSQEEVSTKTTTANVRNES